MSKEICFISSPGNGLFLTASPRTTPNAGQWHEKANTGWDGGKKATKPPSALGLPRPSTEWLLILPPDLSSNASDALRAARADDRLYDPLCLNRLERVINTHGDILVSNAYDCIMHWIILLQE